MTGSVEVEKLQELAEKGDARLIAAIMVDTGRVSLKKHEHKRLEILFDS